MDIQSDKNSEEKKEAARIALSGKKINHIEKKNETGTEEVEREMELKRITQLTKKGTEQKNIAKIALGSKKISNINKTEEGEKKIPGREIEIPIPTKQNVNKPKTKVSTNTHTLQTQEKGKNNIVKETFLEKIRPKSKRMEQVNTKPSNKVERILPQKNKARKKNKVRTIRTYKNDIANAVKKKDVSIARISIREKQIKREKETIKNNTRKNTSKWVFIAVGILTISISVVLLIYKLDKTGVLQNIFKKTNIVPNKNINMVRPIVQSLVPANTEKDINISNRKNDAVKIIDEELQKKHPADTIENIYLYNIVSTVINKKTQQKQEIVSTKDFIRLRKNKMPDILSRSLEKKFMVGIYSTQKGYNIPFLILTTNSYAQTFAGMIEWEQNLRSDFYRLFNIEPVIKTSNLFQDVIIKGEDTRVLTDNTGKILIIYSFVNKKTILITINKQTFNAILQKINH